MQAELQYREGQDDHDVHPFKHHAARYPLAVQLLRALRPYSKTLPLDTSNSQVRYGLAQGIS